MEETTPPSDYTKGFNEGYTLEKYLPELAGELVKAVSDTMRGIGFSHGRDQFLSEKERDLRPEWLRGNTQERGLMDDRNTPSPDLEPDR